MTRKLCSVLLSACALLLLMGAGVAPQQAAAIVIEEESVPLAEMTLETDIQSAYEVNDGFLPAVVGATPVKLAKGIDDNLVVDGVHAQADIGKTEINGVTYVALGPMAKMLNRDAAATWNESQGTVTVTAPGLH